MLIGIERVLPLRFGLGGPVTTIVPNGFALQGEKDLKIALLVQKCACEETRNQPRERILQVTLVRSQAASTVPSYSRYREAALRGKETLLIEEVQSGSRLYSLEIAARVHRRHYQVLWVDDGEADVGLDERRRLVHGPADIVIQPNVVSGFRFAPYTDGLVLTLASDYW